MCQGSPNSRQLIKITLINAKECCCLELNELIAATRHRLPSSATPGPTSSSSAWLSAPRPWTSRAFWPRLSATCRPPSRKRNFRPNACGRWRRRSARCRSSCGPPPRCKSTLTSSHISRSSRCLQPVNIISSVTRNPPGAVVKGLNSWTRGH